MDLKHKSSLDLALRYLSYRNRTEGEMRQFLLNKGIDSDEVDLTINKLVSLGYINDDVFADEYIRCQMENKTISKTQLYYKMLNLKIHPDTAKTALDRIDTEKEQFNIMKLISKLYKTVQSKYNDGETIKKAILHKLLSRGFEYTISKNCIESFFMENNFPND